MGIVLYAEDNTIIRELMVAIFSEVLPPSLTLVTKQDGQSASEYIEAHHDQIVTVITDFQMPRANGEFVMSKAQEKGIRNVIVHSSCCECPHFKDSMRRKFADGLNLHFLEKASTTEQIKTFIMGVITPK